ncbi:MAG TPA: YibE/F family protein [Acidimicrobiales bacterium]|nr:YibE/F family protein [Acidimicrobiales bacterium]
MSHAHDHRASHAEVPARVRRLLVIAVAPFAVATVLGLAVLWPRDAPSRSTLAGPAPELYNATIVGHEPGSCGAAAPGVASGQESSADSGCLDITLVLEDGPERGERQTIFFTEGPGAAKLDLGDRIVAGRSEDSAGVVSYYFADFQRRTPMLALGVVFVIAVVLFGRRRGLAALASLAVSLAVLIKFVLPAILTGKSPLAVAVVGAASVMFVALYVTHGFNPQTTAAVLGTLVSLTLICVLGALFVRLSHFTGLATEEAGFLQLSAGSVNLQGLLLGGLVIGSLGVLDDVTVTQASAVWQLHDANPAAGARSLYRSALEIGRDHIASTVNTLVLAYAGASLPLLILFVIAGPRFSNVITSETVAEEIVRTLVGSIGLVASVPVTTALAAFIVTQRDGAPEEERERGSATDVD